VLGRTLSSFPQMRGQRSIDEYLARRLGPGSPLKMALNMVTRSFTATSLRSFWRYWNAGFNYYLLNYCYRPARRFVSHAAALLTTFAVCGFAHDVLFVFPVVLMHGHRIPFPFVTCWFVLIGSCILLADRLHISFERLPARLRVAVHSFFLALTFACTMLLERLL
jgi:hypothetical protein